VQDGIKSNPNKVQLYNSQKEMDEVQMSTVLNSVEPNQETVERKKKHRNRKTRRGKKRPKIDGIQTVTVTSDGVEPLIKKQKLQQK